VPLINASNSESALAVRIPAPARTSERELEIRISCRLMEMCWREARFSWFVLVSKENCGERETRNGSELGSSNRLLNKYAVTQRHVEAVLKIGEAIACAASLSDKYCLMDQGRTLRLLEAACSRRTSAVGIHRQ
jgi:hypothetical protein